MKIKVNGIELAYEKSGTGSPVIFLHGNGEDHTIFRETIEKLTSDYTVYALDSRCHGESSASEHLSYSCLLYTSLWYYAGRAPANGRERKRNYGRTLCG